MKRQNYLSWHKYFMEIAKLSAQRSKDPNTQVGACIVDIKNRIVGIGYNGYPRGCSDDIFSWERPDKYLYVVHAEPNAILNSNKKDLSDCRIYVTLHPCDRCAGIIIQSGIKEMIWLDKKYDDTKECQAARMMFLAANVQLTHYSVYEPGECND